MIPLRVIDCIDFGKTKFDERKDDPADIKLRGPVCIDCNRIPNDATLFLLEKKRSWLMIRDDFVEKIRKAGFRGPLFTEELIRYS